MAWTHRGLDGLMLKMLILSPQTFKNRSLQGAALEIGFSSAFGPDLFHSWLVLGLGVLGCLGASS